MKFNVMTYNIHHGEGTDKQTDLHRIAEIIEKSNADIIGLNEVDKYFSKRSHYQDQVSWLAEKTNRYYAFAPALTIKSKASLTPRQYGNALLSRYPIITKKVYPFDFIKGLTEGRSILDATIQCHEKKVQLNITHLSLNPFLHRIQTNFIQNQRENYSYPVIIMGDFNRKPCSRAWKKMSSVFHDVWSKSGKGEGFTYPSLRPRSRLDYIFAGPDIDILDAEVLTSLPQASDHLPLKACLRL